MTKVDITIKDVNLNEAQKLLALISGQTVSVQPQMPAAPAQHQPADNTTAGTAGGLPPIQTAPAAPQNFAAPAQPSAASDEVDADGLPWDERIHSSSKKKTAKNVWARRKNVDDSVFDQVVAELRSGGNGGAAANYGQAPSAPSVNAVPSAPVMPAAPMAPAQPMPVPAFLQNMPQAQAAVPMAPAMPAAPMQPATPPMPAAAPMAPAPVQPMQPAAPMAPAAPQIPQGQTITDLFTKIQHLFQTGAADVNYVMSIQTRLSTRWGVEVTSINDIANRPDMIADAFALIAADGK